MANKNGISAAAFMAGYSNCGQYSGKALEGQQVEQPKPFVLDAEHQRLEHLRDAKGSLHDLRYCLRAAGDTDKLRAALDHWTLLMDDAIAQAEHDAGECDGSCPADVEGRAEAAAADADYVAAVRP